LKDAPGESEQIFDNRYNAEDEDDDEYEHDYEQGQLTLF
jgi:hypothetical protein